MLTREQARKCAALVGWIRVGFGTAFIAAPARTAFPWIGAPAQTTGGTIVTRSMGVRDGLLGVGLLRALRSGDDSAATAALTYGATAGAVDAAATLVGWRVLTPTGRGFLVFIGTATVVDALLARALARSG